MFDDEIDYPLLTKVWLSCYGLIHFIAALSFLYWNLLTIPLILLILFDFYGILLIQMKDSQGILSLLLCCLIFFVYCMLTKKPLFYHKLTIVLLVAAILTYFITRKFFNGSPCNKIQKNFLV